MADYITSNSTLLFFAVMLIIVMRVRLRVSPRASLLVRQTAAKVFEHLDVWDGKDTDFGRVRISHRLVDAETQTYEFTYATTMVGGASRSSMALFRIATREPNSSFVLRRAGLEGKSENSELLELNYKLTPEGDGTRLSVVQVWGPRPLLAQVLARADLWGGAYRIKGLIETGVPNEWAYSLISAAVAVVTGLLTLATFSWVVDMQIAVLLIVALVVHEFGHLIAYRLIGQPWGRIMFLPFVGAVALPRLAFESQAQLVFAALMGPGFSIVFGLACLAPALLGMALPPLLSKLGLITAALNIFNLTPVAPLDGGIAMRSVLSRIMGNFFRIGFLLLALGFVAIGIEMRSFYVVALGILTLLMNFRAKKIDPGLAPLSSFQVGISIFAYVAMCAAYLTLLIFFYQHVSQLKPSAVL
jgi:Zn-dependent protease